FARGELSVRADDTVFERAGHDLLRHQQQYQSAGGCAGRAARPRDGGLFAGLQRHHAGRRASGRLYGGAEALRNALHDSYQRDPLPAGYHRAVGLESRRDARHAKRPGSFPELNPRRTRRHTKKSKVQNSLTPRRKDAKKDAEVSRYWASSFPW